MAAAMVQVQVMVLQVTRGMAVDMALLVVQATVEVSEAVTGATEAMAAVMVD